MEKLQRRFVIKCT